MQQQKQTENHNYYTDDNIGNCSVEKSVPTIGKVHKRPFFFREKRHLLALL